MEDEQIEFIDPVACPEWDSLLITHPGATVFHSSGWARALSDTYSYDRKYLVVRRAGRLLGLFPLMEIDSIFTGKRAVSLPFSDYCDCLETEEAKIASLWKMVCIAGENAGWRYIESRARNFSCVDIPAYDSFVGHELALNGDEERIWNCLKGSNRTFIRKAKKEGVVVLFSSTLEAVRSFYNINCITRQHHGLPPQPYSFFEKLQSNVLSKGNGFVVLASHGGKIIAGIVCLHFGKKAHYKYGASLREYQNLRPNNLILWEAIRWYQKEGFESFCFGRTELANEGLRRFKLGFGAREYDISYVRYGLKEREYCRRKPTGSGILSRAMQRTPVSILKKVGEVLYRHMG